MHHVVEDTLFGFRLLRRTPGWTAAVVLSLGLGIGLSTAIFSVVYGVLLQPLPYPAPHRLVAIWPSAPNQAYQRFNVNAALWLHWREHTKSFEEIALTRHIANFNLTGEGAPERLQGARASANLNRVLGVQPAMGRMFTEEERLGDVKVAVLSHRLWQRRFGGDQAILGRKIPLNGEPYEVIGVMPREYRYPSAEYEVWTPLYIPAAEIKHGQNHQYITVARLKPGVTIEQARSEMQGVMARLIEANRGVYGSVGQEIGALIEPLAESDAVQVKSMLFALLAAAGCVLLIGCMNLGILLLARASARARELTVRVALGASGGQLRLQMLAEVVPLGLAGAAGGLLFSSWILQALLPLLPTDTPRVDQVGLHGPVLAFAVVVSFAVVLLAGLLPAWISARTNLAGTLQQNSRGVSSAGTARNWLVVAQVAVTVVLLFGASLFARSFRALSQVNPGFSTEGTLTMHMAVTRAKYRTDKQVSDYYDRLVARIESIPGVTRAGIVNRLPLSGTTQTGGIEFEGKEGKFDADWRSATPGYFEAIGIPIRRGRLFSGSDRPETPGVGLIDEHLARQVFGTEDPLGKRFRIAIPGVPWTQIVGVVGHIRHESPEKDVRPQVYWPESQRPQERAALVVKTSGPPESFTRAVIDQIHQEEPAQPVYDVRAMNQWLERSLKPRTLMTSLVGLFAGASLLLACLGLYGVVSYTAGLRLREFGIRIALGANSRHVGGLVLRHAGKLALWGSIAGLALAWPVGRAIQTLLFGVSFGDAASWIAAPAVLIVVGLLAALGPARRASGTDPAITLRAE